MQDIHNRESRYACGWRRGYMGTLSTITESFCKSKIVLKTAGFFLKSRYDQRNKTPVKIYEKTFNGMYYPLSPLIFTSK